MNKLAHVWDITHHFYLSYFRHVRNSTLGITFLANRFKEGMQFLNLILGESFDPTIIIFSNLATITVEESRKYVFKVYNRNNRHGSGINIAEYT